MQTFFRVLSRVFALLGILTIAMIAIVWVDGQNLADSGGAIWAKTHAPSLLYFQTIVQRHLHLPGLWDNYIIPILELPAWVGMLGVGVAFLFLALFFALFGRSRPKSGNAFESSIES